MPATDTRSTLTLLCPGALASASLPSSVSLNEYWPAGWRHAEVIERHVDTSLVAQELPHEAWLRQRFGVPASDSVDASAAAFDDVPLPAMRLTPVHLHTGRDHLLLTDPHQLELSLDDARALGAAIEPLLVESGLRLTIASPLRWYLSPTTVTATPGALPATEAHGWRLALGRSIDAYLSRDPATRPWRRLINEIQMTWYEHPVNERREQQRLKPVNTLWLEGRVSQQTLPVQLSLIVASDDPAVLGLAQLAGLDRSARLSVAQFSAWLAQPPASRRPEARSALMVADFWKATGSDGYADEFLGAWKHCARWLSSTGLDKGTVPGFDQLRLVLCGDRSQVCVQTSGLQRWMFWKNARPDSWLERHEALAPA